MERKHGIKTTTAPTGEKKKRGEAKVDTIMTVVMGQVLGKTRDTYPANSVSMTIDSARSGEEYREDYHLWLED